jgi:transposase InsO family protein
MADKSDNLSTGKKKITSAPASQSALVQDNPSEDHNFSVAHYQVIPSYKIISFDGVDASVYSQWRQQVQGLFALHEVSLKDKEYPPASHCIIMASLKDAAMDWYLADPRLMRLAKHGKGDEFISLADAKFKSDASIIPVFQNFFSLKRPAKLDPASLSTFWSDWNRATRELPTDPQTFRDMVVGFVLLSKFDDVPHVKHILESASHGWDVNKIRDFINTAVVRGPAASTSSPHSLYGVAAIQDTRRPYCTHCRRPGHTVNKCFRIHGYPPNFGDNNHKKKKSDNDKASPSAKPDDRKDVSAIAVEKPADSLVAAVRSLPVSVKPAVYKLMVDGQPLDCLYDTGAQVSVVREDVLRLVASEHSSSSSSSLSLRSADGTVITSKGQVILSVEVDGKCLAGVFQVVEECPYHIILGLPFIDDYGIKRDTVAPFKLSVTTAPVISVISSSPAVETLLADYKDNIVARLEDGAGAARVPPMSISLTPEARPSFQRNFRLSGPMAEEVAKEVVKLVRSGAIEPCPPTSSSRGWNSPLLVVRKKDGDLRVCVDLRKLNQVTLKENVELPDLHALIEKVAESKFFSKIDMASGYYQIPLAEDSKDLVRFMFRDQQYRFNVVPFGLTNAPATFQRIMFTIFAGIPGVEIMLDDLTIHSPDESSHMASLRRTFDKIKEANLKVNSRKCEFFKSSISIFGFLVSHHSIRPDPARVEALSKLRIPSSTKELLSLLGAFNYYRHCLPGYAKLEAVLRTAIEGDDLKWTASSRKAFEDLVSLFREAPSLHPFDFRLPTEVHTDASQLAMGAVLLQVRENKEFPVAFFSRMFKETQKRYPTTLREFQGVFEALKHWRHYLDGIRFRLVVDHKPLVYMLTRGTKAMDGTRWAWRFSLVSAFDFEIVYRPGKDHKVPDVLSRIVGSISVSFESLEEAQRFDSDTRKLLDKEQAFIDEDKIVKFVGKNGFITIVLPACFRLQAMKEAHVGPVGGHLGRKCMLGRLRQSYFWPNMDTSVALFISNCGDCQRNFKSKRLAAIPVHLGLGDVGETVAVDHFGPFVVNQVGSKRWVLVIIDMFTKFVEAELVDSPDGLSTAKHLLRYFTRFGIPKSVLSDNGSAFLNQMVSTVFEKFGVKQKTTTPYNPQGNGIVERAIGTIKTSLFKTCMEKPLLTADQLQFIVSAYNDTPHSTTSYAPTYLFLARRPRLPLETVLTSSAFIPPEQVIRDRAIAADRILQAQLNQDRRLAEDGKVDEARVFKPGDKVWIYNEKANRMFHPRYDLVLEVVGNFSPNTYILKDLGGKILNKPVNVRRIIPFVPTILYKPIVVDSTNSTQVEPLSIEPESPTTPVPAESNVLEEEEEDEWLSLRYLYNNSLVPGSSSSNQSQPIIIPAVDPSSQSQSALSSPTQSQDTPVVEAQLPSVPPTAVPSSSKSTSNQSSPQVPSRSPQSSTTVKPVDLDAQFVHIYNHGKRLLGNQKASASIYRDTVNVHLQRLDIKTDKQELVKKYQKSVIGLRSKPESVRNEELRRLTDNFKKDYLR